MFSYLVPVWDVVLDPGSKEWLHLDLQCQAWGNLVKDSFGDTGENFGVTAKGQKNYVIVWREVGKSLGPQYSQDNEVNWCGSLKQLRRQGIWVKYWDTLRHDRVNGLFTQKQSR